MHTRVLEANDFLLYQSIEKQHHVMKPNSEVVCTLQEHDLFPAEELDVLALVLSLKYLLLPVNGKSKIKEEKRLTQRKGRKSWLTTAGNIFFKLFTAAEDFISPPFKQLSSV